VRTRRAETVRQACVDQTIGAASGDDCGADADCGAPGLSFERFDSPIADLG